MISNNSNSVIFLCVNYNSYPELLNYINSIQLAYQYGNKNIKVDVVVADNTVTNIQRIDTSQFEAIAVTIRQYHKNLGYMGAIMELIKDISYNTVKTYDYVILSNVDLLLSESFFTDLLRISHVKTIGWIAPQIFSLAEKRDRNPKILKRPTLKRINILLLLYKYPILYTLYKNWVYKFRDKKLDSPTNNEIYAGHGSFMIFTKTFINEHASFQFPSFLFGEEIFFGELARESGLKVIYMPQILVKDVDHVSTSKLKMKNYCKMNYESLKKLKQYFDNEHN